MDERLLVAVENGPIVRGNLRSRLVVQPRVRLHFALHLVVDDAAQLDRVFRLVQKKVVCNVFPDDDRPVLAVLRLLPRLERVASTQALLKGFIGLMLQQNWTLARRCRGRSVVIAERLRDSPFVRNILH